MPSWLIHVPMFDNDGQPFTEAYDREWDAKVRAISNGLTIYKKARGQWHSVTGKLHEEYILPVKIACSAEEIRRIEDITAEHFRQKAIFCEKVSDEVHLVHYDENFRRKHG